MNSNEHASPLLLSVDDFHFLVNEDLYSETASEFFDYCAKYPGDLTKWKNYNGALFVDVDGTLSMPLVPFSSFSSSSSSTSTSTSTSTSSSSSPSTSSSTSTSASFFSFSSSSSSSSSSASFSFSLFSLHASHSIARQ
jgi:hypothetical protein